MLRKVRLKKYRKIKEGPKKLNFGASKPGVIRRTLWPKGVFNYVVGSTEFDG